MWKIFPFVSSKEPMTREKWQKLKVRQRRNYFSSQCFFKKKEQTNSTIIPQVDFGRNWRHQNDISKLTDLFFYFSIFNDEFYSHTEKTHLALGNLTKLVFWSILSVKNWKVNTVFVSVFSGARFFWRNERKYFTYIPGLGVIICLAC